MFHGRVLTWLAISFCSVSLTLSTRSRQTLCSDCAAESAQLATATANYNAAESALISADYAYSNDPNPTTAAQLATATANYNAAAIALANAQAAYDACTGGGGGEPPAMYKPSIDQLAGTVSILER